MPRKSAAAMSVVGVTTAEERPEPPGHLCKGEKDIWRQIVQRMPVDWFPGETLPLLESYVCHAWTNRQVERQLRKFSVDELVEEAEQGAEEASIRLDIYNKLSIIKARESSAMSNLGTKLRLNISSRVDPAKAGRHTRTDGAVGSRGVKLQPWELGEDEEERVNA